MNYTLNEFQEIREKRTYNQKTFLEGNGDKRLRASLGHVHYFNKLGIGDGEQRFREIDWTLQWVEELKAWTFLYHSFHPVVPEYADEWIEFRDLYQEKDRTIRYRAIAAHVQGRLITAENLETEGLRSLTPFNCVMYDNAFGEGIDYIVYFTRSTLKKVVRIRTPSTGSDDMEFEFELDIPEESVFRGRPGHWEWSEEEYIHWVPSTADYQLDTSREKVFDTDKVLFLGSDLGNGKEWFTYMRTFLAWDDHENQIVINVRYRTENGRKFLTKVVPRSFIDAADGPVYTDTTTSYYADAGGDGLVRCVADPNWDTAHDATTGVATANSTTSRILGSSLSGTDYDIRRGFIPADTSGIDDAATVTATLFKIYLDSKGANASAADICFVQSTQASATGLVADDYNNCGTVDAPTEGATRISMDQATGGYITMTLNATGRGWVSKTGYTMGGIRTSKDVDDVAPTVDNIWNTFRMADTADVTSDPYYEVTYSTGTAVTDTRDFETAGKVTTSDTRDFETQGKAGTSDTRDFETSGRLGSSDTRDFETAGKLGTSDTRDFESSGKLGTNDTRNIETSGKLGTSDTRDMETAGKVSTTDTRNIETSGKAAITSDRSFTVEGPTTLNTTERSFTLRGTGTWYRRAPISWHQNASASWYSVP